MQHILLLHGAIGAKDQLLSLSEELGHEYNVHLINFAGHGGEKMTEEDFSISLFTQQVLNYINFQKIDRINLFGYSMGGYVALYFASLYPDRVIKLVTLATKFNWNEETAAREVKMLDPKKMQEKVPAFVKELQLRHTEQAWEILLNKTSNLLQSLGQTNILDPERIACISAPALLLLGDRDKMVSLEETVIVFKQLPNGRLAVLPATPHPIDQVNLKRLVFEISEFIN